MKFSEGNWPKLALSDGNKAPWTGVRSISSVLNNSPHSDLQGPYEND